MRSFVYLAIALVGCGASRFKTEHVGVVPLGNGGSVTLARGNYQLAMRFDVPRAQIVEWTLRCPSVERAGVAGETFESYRTRRLAELQRMVEQDRHRLATVTNVIGAHAGAAVQVQGPATTVSAEARAPSGEVVAEQAIQQIHELPYGDVGAGSYTTAIHVQTAQDGECTLSTKAIDPVGGTIAVDRIRDLRAEKQERVAAQNTTAIDARMRVRTRLVALGADEHARERRIAEEARRREEERIARERREEENRLRLEAEARLKWESEAPERERRARLEAERNAALEARRIAMENERLAREAKEEEARRARMVIVERERLERTRILEEERRARMVIVERERLERTRIIEEERRTRILIIERERSEALRVRGAYVAWLVGTCNADPHRLARMEVERVERMRRIEIERVERMRRIEIERVERERRIEIENERLARERRERERRIEIENERVARERREREQHELRIALSVRAQLAGYLVAAGARLRPPRPNMIVEVAGTAPFDGARWEAGVWIWVQESWSWQWRKGGWVDSTQFGDTGGDVVVRAPVLEAPTVTTRTVTTTTSSTTTSQPSTTVVAPATTVIVPAGVTVEVPRGSITIDVRPSPPTRTKKPARVRDHRRR
ncbi:MAG: hypothetical protein ACKV2T_01830 [Kofleriaceae bacterium]